MRNFLTHEYPKIKPAVVWDTIIRDLPTLEPQLERILEENPPDSK